MNDDEASFWTSLVGLCLSIIIWGFILGFTNGGHTIGGDVIPPIVFYFLNLVNVVLIVYTAIGIWEYIKR